MGGNLWCLAGTGGSAAAGNNTGGAGGSLLLVSGAGGASTGSADNSAAGPIRIVTGSPGTGGSGAAGAYGNITLETAAGTLAFVTSNAAGPGFGIGTTPGTDPTITRGTGVPATTQPNGSLFMRTDGGSASLALYSRQSGAWVALGGGGGSVTWANDLVGSTSTNQYVAAISGNAGGGGTVSIGGSTNTTLSWLASQTTAIITQATPSSDVATHYMQIAAQTAFASASTNKNGGNLILQTGTAASGGVNGDLYLQSGPIAYAFVASEASGTGFGIGTTPGTDPTITRGSGVPGSTQPAGSLFLNTTAATVATALYARVGSSWVAIGGGGSFTAGGTSRARPHPRK